MIRANRPVTEVMPSATVSRPMIPIHTRIAGNRKTVANEYLRDAISDDEYKALLEHAKEAF